MRQFDLKDISKEQKLRQKKTRRKQDVCEDLFFRIMQIFGVVCPRGENKYILRGKTTPVFKMQIPDSNHFSTSQHPRDISES